MTIAGREDNDILSLFDDAGPLETPTPGVRAWLANDASNGKKPVIIKRVEAGNTGKGRATEALALMHPNIVRTRRWLTGSETGALYVVRDVVRGRNLRQSLAADTMRQSAEAVRQILMPVLDALEYAHGQGFAHGGVSPANVLVGEGGQVFVSDFATADPKAPQHFQVYNGTASIGGDVKALSRVVTEFLPKTGAFANPVVRGRIEGIVERCDTLGDLRETVNALERLAAAPVPRGSTAAAAAGPPPVPPPTVSDPTVGDWAKRTGPPFPGDPPKKTGTARLTCTLLEKSARVAQGGGGTATLILKNEGDASLIVRMVATQHAWLNVRPMELPITIPPGGAQEIGFVISAARLTPGDYRSEVYMSANTAGRNSEDLRGGWFKHTCEMRVTVEGGGAFIGGGSGGAGSPPNAPLSRADTQPPPPGNAPRVPGGPGCGILVLPLLLALFVLPWIG